MVYKRFKTCLRNQKEPTNIYIYIYIDFNAYLMNNLGEISIKNQRLCQT